MADEEKTASVNDAAAPQLMSGPVTVTLTKAVPSGDGTEVKELKFREPTGGDIERCGQPLLIDMLSGETPKISFDTKAMSAMMAVLAAVPPSTIRHMNAADWNTAAWSLARFFMPVL